MTTPSTQLTPKLPPKAKGVPWFGPVFEFIRDPLHTLETIHKTQGDIVRTSFAGMSIFILSNPSYIEHVLIKNRHNYTKDWFLRKAQELLGQGLLTSEGELWKRQRKLIAPAFAYRQLPAYIPTIQTCTETAFQRWISQDTIDVGKEMMELTLEIALQSLFGSEAGEDAQRVGRAFEVVSEYYAGIAGTPLSIPLWIPTPTNRRFSRARQELYAVVDRIIREKKQAIAQGAEETNLLATLLAVRDEDGNPMDETQLRDEVIILLLAGHETTAQALTFTWYLLDRHPAVREKLEEEIQQNLPSGPFPASALRQLPYTQKVIRESMRLYPPAPMIGREAIKEDVIDGWRIPAKATLLIPQWVVQRDSKWFQDPEVFRPERWTPELELNLPRFAYFPFGGGHRICVGEAFAMIELTVVISLIAKHARLKNKNPRPLELLTSFTNRPKHPIIAELEPTPAPQTQAETSPFSNRSPLSP